MNINNNRTPDLDKIFNSRWQANNYNYNGVKENVDKNKEQFNRMFNIKSKEERKKEMLQSNSVEGRVDSLNRKMGVLKMYNNNNNFR